MSGSGVRDILKKILFLTGLVGYIGIFHSKKGHLENCLNVCKDERIKELYSGLGWAILSKSMFRR